MNDEELKKKIVGMLKEAMKPIEYGGDREHAPEVHYPTEEEIADTLIAAGIGDVKEAQRRVEVRERALKICLIDNLHCYECDIGFDGKCKGTDKDKEKCAMLEIDYYIQQAEKELAEERKND